MFKPKKSLGQNFLKSKEALRAIVQAGNISEKDIILEVGPGKGALTEMLLPAADKVIAIEKDQRLIPILHEKFAHEIQNGKLKIIEQDILDYESRVLKKYKLIANIPYYITGVLIRKFLSGNNQPERMVLLLQKEVAERIVARDKKESLLSISVKVFGVPKYIQTVKARYFSPVPRVDSAIIAIEGISKNNFRDISEDLFFELVKAGFAHKRKKVLRNLESFFKKNNINLDTLEKIFEDLHINKNARPEDLTLADYLALTNTMA
jgi:16S rRNA (adenine1518-N6/adenine1519-N6)-dimethyltransferase